VNEAGLPAIAELSLMHVTSQWLPIEDSFEKRLVEQLVRDGRSFVKGLRYNLPPGRPIVSAFVTDVVDGPIALHIARGMSESQPASFGFTDRPTTDPRSDGVWQTCTEGMPALPRRRTTASAPPRTRQPEAVSRGADECVRLAGGRPRSNALHELHLIERAAHAPPTAVEHVGVDHRGGYVAVAEQLLHGPDVVARLQQVGRE
jgi:Protein of unknown function (DUF1173)